MKNSKDKKEYRNHYYKIEILKITKYFIIFNITFITYEGINLNKKRKTFTTISSLEERLIKEELLIEEYNKSDPLSYIKSNSKSSNSIVKKPNKKTIEDYIKIITSPELTFKQIWNYLNLDKKSETHITYWGKGILFEEEFLQENLYLYIGKSHNFSLAKQTIKNQNERNL